MSELEIFKKESFKHLKEISDKFSDVDVYSEMSAPIRKDLIKEMEYIKFLDSAVQEQTEFDECVKFHKEVAGLFIVSNLVHLFVRIIADYPFDEEYPKTTDDDEEMLSLALCILLNYTDESDALANEVAKTKVMESCKIILQRHSEQHVTYKETEYRSQIIKLCIGVVQNVSVRDCNVERLRSLEFTDVIQPYLRSENEDISMLALTILANIVTEEECHIIGEHVSLVQRLLFILQRGLEEEERRYFGWSCKELGQAVRNLARNDANKKLLWSINAIQILVEMARTGNNEEIYESVHAIWALVFDENIRANIAEHQEMHVVELFVNLQEDETSNDDIRNSCTKALWTLRKEITDSPILEYRTAVEKIRPAPAVHGVQEGHIMISYQSADRKLLCKIKNELVQQKYKTWMDVEDMYGNTLDAMASAVENASVVLLCYSRRYKQSDNCRLEAIYAHERKIPFIPLKMESNYKPDGWLGLMLGSKYYVDFSGKYTFEDALKILLKELSKIPKAGQRY